MRQKNRERNSETSGYGKNYGADYDEDLGFFDNDSSWRSTRGFRTGVERNDYGNNELLKEHFGPSYYGKGPKGWKRSDDKIREEVCEALYKDERIDASDVDVNVLDSCVYLKGSVVARDIKRSCEDVAESITGVEDVINELRVRKAGEGIPTKDPASIERKSDQQDSNTFS